jgi:hypothetical protein
MRFHSGQPPFQAAGDDAQGPLNAPSTDSFMVGRIRVVRVGFEIYARIYVRGNPFCEYEPGCAVRW